MEMVLERDKENEMVGVGDREGNTDTKMAKSGYNEVFYASVEDIMPNRAQPRKDFDVELLEELSESIRENGVIQPIVVRKCRDVVGSVFGYELVAGERRLRAAKMVGLKEIPCILVEVGEEKSAELAIIENLHRKDLNIFETASAIMSLINIYGVTQEEIARKLSLTQPAIANKLRLLRLSEAEREVIVRNSLTERHARGLLRVEDEELRWYVLEKIVENNMNVKQTERYIDGVLSEKDVAQCVGEGGKMCGYVNVIQKAIDRLRKMGCKTKSTCTETDEFYIYTITVDKNKE